MTTIRMYNVGFGDCYLLHDKKWCFLVDCGTKNAWANYKPVINDLNSELSTNSSILLISHFHFDHTKLLFHLQSSLFSKIYVRNIYQTPVSYWLFVYQLLWAFAYGGPEDWDASLFSLFFVHRARQLLKPGGKIVFVRRGSRFQFHRIRYQVLSPFSFGNPDPEGFQERLIWLCEIAGIQNEIDKLKKLWEQDAEHYGNMRTISSPATKNEDALDDKNEDYRDNFKEKNGLVNAIRGKLEKGEVLNRSALRERLKKLSDLEHKFNVVFMSKKLQLLMCGDEEPEDMYKILFNIGYKTPIQTIKIPHHGTLTHFVSFAHLSPKLGLISNGPWPNYDVPCCRYLFDFQQVFDTNRNMCLLCVSCQCRSHYFNCTSFYQDFPL